MSTTSRKIGGRVPLPDAHLIASTKALLAHIEDYDLPFPAAISSPAMPENPDSLLVRVNVTEYRAWIEAMYVDSEDVTPVDAFPGVIRSLFHGRTVLGLRITVFVFRPAPLHLVGA